MENLAARTEAEIERIRSLPIAELRVLWRSMFKSEPPEAFGPDLLRRSIAYRVQEKAFGGLSSPTRKLLDQLVRTHAAKPDGRIHLPRRIKPGSVLVREWKRCTYRVMVLDQGFAYEGRTYGNLSEIARAITGTRWNGPRFFGLRQREDADESNAGSGDRTGPDRAKRRRSVGSGSSVKQVTEAADGL